MLLRLQRLLIVLSLLMTAGVEHLARGEDVTAERVHQLVEQLNDSSRRVRLEAERTLDGLGPAVLLHLPAPEQLKSAATRDAVLRVRDALQRQQAEVSASASRVSLMGEFTLREVLRAISAQTGNGVITSDVPDNLLDSLIDINWQDASFWEAIHDVELSAGLSVHLDSKVSQLELRPLTTNDDIPRVVNKGAFRIMANSYSRRRDFTNEDREILRVGFQVFAEPRLRPLFVRVKHADFQLVANDATLTPLNQDAKLERPADHLVAIPLTVDFVTSKANVIDVVTLIGRLEIELAAGEESFIFRNLSTSEHVVRRRGGVTVTMERAQFSSGGDGKSLKARVDLRVAYDSSGPAFESHRTWVFHNKTHLQSPDGKIQWSPDGFDTVAEAEAAVKLSYRFKEITVAPSTLEFVYSAPTLLLSVPVEFELSDLPAKPLEGE